MFARLLRGAIPPLVTGLAVAAVTVAVLSAGADAHDPGLAGTVGAQGTVVASLIAGRGTITGIAPANILSLRVTPEYYDRLNSVQRVTRGSAAGPALRDALIGLVALIAIAFGALLVGRSRRQRSRAARTAFVRAENARYGWRGRSAPRGAHAGHRQRGPAPDADPWQGVRKPGGPAGTVASGAGSPVTPGRPAVAPVPKSGKPRTSGRPPAPPWEPAIRPSDLDSEPHDMAARPLLRPGSPAASPSPFGPVLGPALPFASAPTSAEQPDWKAGGWQPPAGPAAGKHGSGGGGRPSGNDGPGPLYVWNPNSSTDAFPAARDQPEPFGETTPPHEPPGPDEPSSAG